MAPYKHSLNGLLAFVTFIYSSMAHSLSVHTLVIWFMCSTAVDHTVHDATVLTVFMTTNKAKNRVDQQIASAAISFILTLSVKLCAQMFKFICNIKVLITIQKVIIYMLNMGCNHSYALSVWSIY